MSDKEIVDLSLLKGTMTSFRNNRKAVKCSVNRILLSSEVKGTPREIDRFTSALAAEKNTHV